MLVRIIKAGHWLFGAALSVAGFVGAFWGTPKPEAGDWLVQILPWLASPMIYAPALFFGGVIISHDVIWWLIERRMRRASKPRHDMTFREMFDYLKLEAKVSLRCRDWKDWIATVPELVEDELALGHIESWGRMQNGWRSPRPTLQPIKTDTWRGGMINADTCWAHSDEVSPRTESITTSEMAVRSFYYDDLRTNSYQVKLIWPSANLMERHILGFRFGVFKRDGPYYIIGVIYYKTKDLIRKMRAMMFCQKVQKKNLVSRYWLDRRTEQRKRESQASDPRRQD